jgi:geranylgeranyl pyrophosphate synthase
MQDKRQYLSPWFRTIWELLESLRPDGPILSAGTVTASDVCPTRDYRVDKPFRYVCSLGGKGIRTALVSAVGTVFGLEATAVTTIVNIIQDLHNASLLVDDIEDRSVFRRGAPCAHLLFGTALSINAYGMVMVRTLSELVHTGPPGAVGLVADALECLHRGQGADLQWCESGHVPTLDAYMCMIRYKTGALLALIPRLAALYGTGNPEWWVLRFERFGIYFQIRDDLCNICDPAYWATKGFFEDLDEGKMSYIVLLCLTQDRVGHTRLLELLRPGEASSVKARCLKQEAYSILHACGALHETRLYLLQLRAWFFADEETTVVLGPALKVLYVPEVPESLTFPL